VHVFSLLDGEQQRAKKIKPKLSMAESFKYLTSSPYLGYIAIMVIAYGLSINFTEVMWKAQVRQMYPDKQRYQQFMGMYSSILGAATFLVILFGSRVIQTLGWLVGAVSTPVLMGALAAPFFSFIIFGLKLGDPKVALATAVYVGLVQNVLSKAVKYALFDPTKEMAYIPLDQESKVKGKAAIDVLASRFGKSGGSLLQQVIVLLFGDVVSGAPAIAAMFYAVLAAWITAATRLGNLFSQKIALESEQQVLSSGSTASSASNSTTVPLS
jgi:AAA family ATP:ADP antiporter